MESLDLILEAEYMKSLGESLEAHYLLFTEYYAGTTMAPIRVAQDKDAFICSVVDIQDKIEVLHARLNNLVEKMHGRGEH